MLIQVLFRRLYQLASSLRAGPRGDRKLIAALTEHIEKNFGATPKVFHETISRSVHIDIYVIPPAPDREFYTLVTSGMSERAMPVPDEATHASRYVELVMLLPPDWRLDHRDFADEQWYWPMRHLKMLARAPHEWNTWFGVGHTMQLDASLKPFASNTGFCAYLLAPEPFGDDFTTMHIADGREVSFLMAVPLYAEELHYAREHGSQPLAQLFEEGDVDLVIDPARVNVCVPPQARSA